MTFELEWGLVLPVAVCLAGGLLGSVLSLLRLPRQAVPGVRRSQTVRAMLGVSVGLLVAASTLALDFLIEGPPRVLMLSAVAESSPPPSWLSSTLPTGTTAPDFTLADLHTGAPVHFSVLRGERPAVLLFGSFG